ncbi:hypothetical protein HKCCE2091_18665 [Rhodobacterales bacterium HKCCE2091]|nr:hypothetical protein [Rhodobacterales bacterium HKCCE2091]
MTDRVSPLRHAAYRLKMRWHVVALTVLPVLAGAVFAGAVGGVFSAYYAPEEILRTVAIATILATVATLLLPACPFEHVAAGIVAGVIVGAEPWLGDLFQPEFKGGAFTPHWVRAAQIGGAAFMLWSLVLAGIVKLCQLVPAPVRGYRYRLTLGRAAPRDIRAAFALRPGETSGGLSYGALEWDGFVPVRTSVQIHDPLTYAMTESEFRYAIRAVSDDGETEVLEVRPSGGGAPYTMRRRIRSAGRGTRIEVEEDCPLPDLLTWLDLHLMRAGPDLLRSHTDLARGRPTPAIRNLPHRSFAATVARFTRLPRPKAKPSDA